MRLYGGHIAYAAKQFGFFSSRLSGFTVGIEENSSPSGAAGLRLVRFDWFSLLRSVTARLNSGLRQSDNVASRRTCEAAGAKLIGLCSS